VRTSPLWALAGLILAGHPASGPTIDDLATEAAVFEATFQQQIAEQLDATERARGTVLCFAIDPGGAPQSPGPALMRRFAAEKAVRHLGECDRRPAGAVESQTLRPAIIVTVGPIDWIAADEAHVAVSTYRSARAGTNRIYRVVKERSGWISLGPILKDIPVR
jgi:hypothetical protein